MNHTWSVVLNNQGYESNREYLKFSKKTKILINAFKLADAETVIGACMNLR